MSFLKDQGFNPQKAKLLYDPSGKSKGTGFVQMDSISEASKAKNSLSTETLAGRQIVVNMATNQDYW